MRLGTTKKTLHPVYALRDEAPLKESNCVPRFHPNCVLLHATRCAVTGAPGRGSPLHSAVVESPAHGRLLAARPSGRQPSLRHGETGPRFVRIIVLGHLILTHRRQKRRTLCASQDETTSNCSTERRKNQGLIAGKKTNPCVLR